ncbi:glycosyltransferase family 2 protein [Paracoccus sediminicola]|uniref:glycosyltransferase family 2 protein n=1 Tax=Paracoccus sediminicola TaxID=3017783 RepID=UPI0022F0DC54|nr:glycosyltransferase family 2 protein [Paracoccus sediminicola]WBU55825.1 glycosyltransferase family 2 protein [Paracoccus sediminicola]
MTKKQLFTSVKNEAPFLLEWIAYHRAIGFEEFYVCSNDSDDGTTELLNALDKASEIRHFHNHVLPGQSPQLVAAERFRDADLPAQESGDWVIWLDADEFLNIHVGEGKLDDLIDYLGDKTGMLVPWRIFGDSGSDGLLERFLSETFTRSAGDDFPEQAQGHSEQAQIKTLFRMDDCIQGFGTSSLHRPVIKPGAKDILQRFTNGAGGPLDAGFGPHRFWASGGDKARTSKVPLSETDGSIAQINHYLVRTPSMYRLKKRRGRGYGRIAQDGRNDRHTADFYNLMNRNEREDRSILRHLPAVDREISRLLSIKDVSDAHEHGIRQTRAALNALSEEKENVIETNPAAKAAEPVPFELTLPPQEAAMLRSSLKEGGIVLEYGSGGSTFEALGAGASKVFSVESDAEWAKRIDESLAAQFEKDRFRVIHADIGPTKEWGKPANRKSFLKYHLYAHGVWDLEDFREPDLILIDGRFRASCFATAAMRLTRPAKVLFDDYANRNHYHWVEKICPVAEMAGRMAVFHLEPTEIPRTLMTQVSGSYVDSR